MPFPEGLGSRPVVADTFSPTETGGIAVLSCVSAPRRLFPRASMWVSRPAEFGNGFAFDGVVGVAKVSECASPDLVATVAFGAGAPVAFRAVVAVVGHEDGGPSTVRPARW